MTTKDAIFTGENTISGFVYSSLSKINEGILEQIAIRLEAGIQVTDKPYVRDHLE